MVECLLLLLNNPLNNLSQALESEASSLRLEELSHDCSRKPKWPEGRPRWNEIIAAHEAHPVRIFLRMPPSKEERSSIMEVDEKEVKMAHDDPGRGPPNICAR